MHNKAHWEWSCRIWLANLWPQLLAGQLSTGRCRDAETAINSRASFPLDFSLTPPVVITGRWLRGIGHRDNSNRRQSCHLVGTPGICGGRRRRRKREGGNKSWLAKHNEYSSTAAVVADTVHTLTTFCRGLRSELVGGNLDAIVAATAAASVAESIEGDICKAVNCANYLLIATVTWTCGTLFTGRILDATIKLSPPPGYKKCWRRRDIVLYVHVQVQIEDLVVVHFSARDTS